MSKLHDLIGKVENAELRAALADECRKLETGKKFGLVFEEHLPEATPIPGAAIKVGATVATKAQDGGALFRVVAIDGDVAKCVPVGGDGGAGGGLIEAALPRAGRSDGRAASMMPPYYQIWLGNRMAVLFDEGAFAAFAREVKAQSEIATVYLITDYEPSFRAMAKSFPGRRVYRLYRDYRDNFRLNQGGRA